MANEAVTIETPTKFARYTVADAVAIPLNTLLKLSGANTAAASTDTTGEIFAGIAWEEKTASDGITEIVAAIDGVHDLNTAGDVTEGGIVFLSGANTVAQATAGELLTGAVVGKMLETGAEATAARTRIGGLV